MSGKGKKIVSVAYKEKLLAEIAHYEKRIEEASTKRKNNVFLENESSDDELNPYKFKDQESWFDLKQQEARLSDRASMTLELSMLTIMQSEVNIMVTPPEVRRPVREDGIWLEVAAECKIDLVSFTITFYAHKPYRRFAPTRYRNVVVDLLKPAHQKELAQSVLPKLNRPHLALQVLQSYATAFRSRRTTLLELAETYADKLKMEAMPGGGYHVKFLNILQVEWTLENMWSPIVPFCHRMKFEVEYMPKDYIHAIGKLYKQFKDPSLETSERTHVLSKIFDTCMEAQGLAREIQESFESDPETASRLHERRTTIDQEPEVPNVEHSPVKPKGKENKAQNRKTNMAPPKTIPKKAKKVDAKRANERKRAIDDEPSNEAKRSRLDNNVDNSKTKPTNNLTKAGLKGGKDGVEDKDNQIELTKTNAKKDTDKESDANEFVTTANSKNNGDKKISSKVNASNKNSKGADDAKKKDGKNKSGAEEWSGDIQGAKKRVASKNDEENKIMEGSDVSSTKKSKKDDNNEVPKEQTDSVSSKKVASTKNNAKKAKSDERSIASSKQTNKSEESVAMSKDKNTAKNRNVKESDGQNTVLSDQNGKGTKSNSANMKEVNDGKVHKGTSKTVATMNADGTKAVSKNLKNKDVLDKTKKAEANVDKIHDIEKTNNETATSAKGNIAVRKETVKNAIHNDKNLVITSNSQKTGNNDKNKDMKKVDRNTITISTVKTTVKENKGTTQTEKKTINTKSIEQKKATVDKVSKVSAQLIKNYELSKKTKPDFVDSNQTKKSKTNTGNIFKETNRDEKQKLAEDKIGKNNKSNDKNTNLNVTITKSKAPTKENKNADILKTKIPIMKNKLTFSSLRDKLNNVRISKVDKPKVAQKLPVFKNVVRNLPTRASPRKLPSTFKPSSIGFSKK